MFAFLKHSDESIVKTHAVTTIWKVKGKENMTTFKTGKNTWLLLSRTTHRPDWNQRDEEYPNRGSEAKYSDEEDKRNDDGGDDEVLRKQHDLFPSRHFQHVSFIWRSRTIPILKIAESPVEISKSRLIQVPRENLSKTTNLFECVIIRSRAGLKNLYPQVRSPSCDHRILLVLHDLNLSPSYLPHFFVVQPTLSGAYQHGFISKETDEKPYSQLPHFWHDPRLHREYSLEKERELHGEVAVS